MLSDLQTDTVKIDSKTYSVIEYKHEMTGSKVSLSTVASLTERPGLQPTVQKFPIVICIQFPGVKMIYACSSLIGRHFSLLPPFPQTPANIHSEGTAIMDSPIFYAELMWPHFETFLLFQQRSIDYNVHFYFLPHFGKCS